MVKNLRGLGQTALPKRSVIINDANQTHPLLTSLSYALVSKKTFRIPAYPTNPSQLGEDKPPGVSRLSPADVEIRR